jgi:hypothetical protein
MSGEVSTGPSDTRWMSGTALRGLETVPTNQSQLLALCVWIRFGGEFSEETR